MASNALALAGPASTSLSLQVNGIEDLQRLARLFAASGLFGRSGNAEQHMAECAIKILAGAEAGFGPFASAGGVTVINGRPGFGSNLLAQAIKRHPQYDYRVLEKTDQVCRIKFLAGREELGIETFTMEMARRAGLVKTSGPWAQYPEAMLFARCLSAGMRTHCPDALGGVSAYTPEELGAQGEIDENGAVVAVTVTEQPQPPTRDQLQAQAMRRLKEQGITGDGMQAMLNQLGGEGARLGQLSDEVLGKLARVGASAETIQRWNADGAPAAAPAPAADDSVPADDDHGTFVLSLDEQDDPDDLPAAWAA
jgi:hypothetical protein